MNNTLRKLEKELRSYAKRVKGVTYRTCTNKLDTKFKINNLRNYILFDKV